MKNKKYETRMSIGCLIILVITIIVLALMQEVKAAELITYRNYTVKANDTLWTIACKLDRNENIQKTISEIRKDNDNLHPIIHVGQVIKIRVK